GAPERNSRMRIPQRLTDDVEVGAHIGLDRVGVPLPHVSKGRRVIAQGMTVSDDAPQQRGTTRRLDLLADNREHGGDATLAQSIKQTLCVLAVGPVIEGKGADKTVPFSSALRDD